MSYEQANELSLGRNFLYDSMWEAQIGEEDDRRNEEYIKIHGEVELEDERIGNYILNYVTSIYQACMEYPWKMWFKERKGILGWFFLCTYYDFYFSISLGKFFFK